MKYLFLAFSSFLCAAAVAQTEQGAFQWKCQSTGRDSMQCAIKNTGTVEASVCLDVVKICREGEHTATLCSDRMRPGEVDTKVLTNFSPKVKFLEKCMGTEFRSKVISR